MMAADDGEADLEYDLAHEGARTPQRPAISTEPVQIANTTPDQGQDYSYDLAHDIPPPDPALDHS